QQADNSPASSARASEAWRAPASSIPPAAATGPLEPPPSIAPDASAAAAIAQPALEKSVEPAAPLLQSGQMVQPTSESIGKDANVDIKTDPAAKLSGVT